ncbi:MAG: METTL5 family protein [Methanobacteriaceae archaeon]
MVNIYNIKKFIKLQNKFKSQNSFKKKHLEMAIEGFPTHPNPNVHLEQYSTPASIAADLLWNAFALGDITSRSVLDLGCGTGILGFSALFLGASTVTGIDIDDSSVATANGIVNDFISNTHIANNNNNNPNNTNNTHIANNNINNNPNNANTIANNPNNCKNANNVDNNNNNTNNTNANNTNNNPDNTNNNSNINFICADINDIKDNIKESIFDINDNGAIDTIIQNPPFGSQKRAKAGADRIFIETSSEIAKINSKLNNTVSTVYSFHMASTEEFVENYFEKLGGTVTNKFRYKFKIANQYSFHKKESKLVKIIVFRVEF